MGGQNHCGGRQVSPLVPMAFGDGVVLARTWSRLAAPYRHAEPCRASVLLGWLRHLTSRNCERRQPRLPLGAKVRAAYAASGTRGRRSSMMGSRCPDLDAAHRQTDRGASTCAPGRARARGARPCVPIAWCSAVPGGKELDLSIRVPEAGVCLRSGVSSLPGDRARACWWRSPRRQELAQAGDQHQPASRSDASTSCGRSTRTRWGPRAAAAGGSQTLAGAVRS